LHFGAGRLRYEKKHAGIQDSDNNHDDQIQDYDYQARTR
jgi:hypothetical protein